MTLFRNNCKMLSTYSDLATLEGFSEIFFLQYFTHV